MASYDNKMITGSKLRGIFTSLFNTLTMSAAECDEMLDEEEEITISFMANANTGEYNADNYPDTEMQEIQRVTKKLSEFLTMPEYERFGYVNQGWATGTYGTGYRFGHKVRVSDIKNNAKYNPETEAYVIYGDDESLSWNLIYNTHVTQKVAYKYRRSATQAIADTSPRANGVTFLGWSLSADGATGIFSASQKVGALMAGAAQYPRTKIVHAVWEGQEFKFDENAEDATGSMNNVISNVDETLYPVGYIEFPQCGYEREGYHFVKWNTRSTGVGTSYLPGDCAYPSGAQNNILYAIWEQD